MYYTSCPTSTLPAADVLAETASAFAMSALALGTHLSYLFKPQTNSGTMTIYYVCCLKHKAAVFVYVPYLNGNCNHYLDAHTIYINI